MRLVIDTARALGALALTLFATNAWAEPGVSKDRIVFGQAAALEGPAAALGQGMKLGLQAAFNEINAKGGINGRKIELVSRDDGYDPGKSIEATRKLIEEDSVFALIGAVGTPTSAAALPIAEAKGVPFIAPFTGAELLRTPFKPNVINVRASYFQETETMVESLTKDRGITKIAILYQDDAFGRAGLAGVQRALEKRKMALAAEGTFERNTVAVKSALMGIKKAEPEAIIMIGPYKPCAEFIKLARKLGMQSLFVNISFVGSDALAAELGPDGAGVIVTQVVPFPGDPSLPMVAQYHAALRAIDAKARPGFVSLEGYVAGRVVIEALKKLSGEPTRKGMVEQLLAGPSTIGGVKFGFGPGNNQGMQDVFLTVIQPNATFKAVTTLKDVKG